MVLESSVERYLVSQIRARGGWCIKWVPVVAGIPDRVVLLPGGRFYLVETKAPGGRLRPVQRVWHARAAKRGHRVWVLASRQEVDEWMSMVDTRSTDREE